MWDRACELYACIKGGWVGYGEAHSAKFGHDRYGRTYPGLYHEWGQVDRQTAKVRKIHIIGHSLGGLTGRTLIQLLESGDHLDIIGIPMAGNSLREWYLSLAAFLASLP